MIEHINFKFIFIGDIERRKAIIETRCRGSMEGRVETREHEKSQTYNIKPEARKKIGVQDTDHT